MKKIIILILGIALVYGCSTSNDGNGNSTTTVVPIAPSNLTGTVVSTTQINLSWTDHSTNETGFKIERKTGSGVYAVVGTTATDITTFSDAGLTPSTTYTYRVYSNNAFGNSLTYSNELNLTTTSLINLPTLTTGALSLITSSSAVSGGTISSDGGATITAKGVCWSTSTNPSINLSTKTSNGTGIGTFTSNITSLSANTIYYLRAYATNSVGTAYGNEIVFTTPNSTTLNVPGPNITDFDGNVYQTVSNCNQTWMKSNLNVSHYRNGDVIPQVTNPATWASLTTGAWCYYNNISANGVVYGKLYNWYAVNDPRGLAPLGYHIPTTNEFVELENCLGGAFNAGGNMKETGVLHWISPNISATNSSGFTALPGGSLFQGSFVLLGSWGNWWTSSELGMSSAFRKTITNDSSSFGGNGDGKVVGNSIRCIKD